MWRAVRAIRCSGDHIKARALRALSTQRNVYVETYGCQMNVSDSEVVLGILSKSGYQKVGSPEDAQVILLNTCAIRDKAEVKIWGRLSQINDTYRKNDTVVGLLGCMAERLKDKLLDKDRLVDIVAGPDSYRDLPNLISNLQSNATAINVQLSLDETYADIKPVRESASKKAFVTIMRGCNNMCTFCIVPYTRGRERSRPVESIEEEVRELSAKGYKEITLLGQNVNSYQASMEVANESTPQEETTQIYAKGFKSVYKPKRRNFALLLEKVARVDPEMRVRFTSPHPKDFSDEVLRVIRKYPNICKQLHMPAQSGSTSALTRMRRGYSRESYVDLIKRTRDMIPGINFSSDFISGFCGETEEEHMQTLTLLEEIGFEQGFLFAYSKRDKTYAARHLEDNVPEPLKKRRLNELISVFRRRQAERYAEEVGSTHLVLVEGKSRHSTESNMQLTGRTCTGKRVVFPLKSLPKEESPDNDHVGSYVSVKIDSSENATLIGTAIDKTTLSSFYNQHGAMWY